jgi:hypothetical protein
MMIANVDYVILFALQDARLYMLTLQTWLKCEDYSVP